ncbi:Histidine ammonia-lyase [Rubellimicrobium mesophilum DSM 19309]|uniref:Histidine ammonia-lyase n=1 Tax=Rubellimicrobium mesophilum DSM 19309 TaxID=442562 RepID=A0A017HLL0_9RHOB|nr:aromatic amino acid lyase [Rubellimicrobium mesophilum]EYD75392.1 Histidine ammonia-lyase [Rubellimicrobium mesophilum DSM 19309]
MTHHDTPQLLHPGDLDLAFLRRAHRGRLSVALPQEAWVDVTRCAALVQDAMRSEAPVYGITTGFGLNARVKIPAEQAVELQRRLVLSHCTGVGPDMPPDVVRLMLCLKVSALAQGVSGVRPQLIEALLRLLANDAFPCIPAKGSVGASGDLAPLAHLGAALMGLGRIQFRGEARPAGEVLREIGLEPYDWQPKEGLALINGTQASTALALGAYFRIEHQLGVAVAVGALTTEAAFGSPATFDPRLHRLRRQPGQIRIASAFRDLLADGPRRDAMVPRRREQDPYSLRCQPQVLGACLDQLRFAGNVLLSEACSVTDNPILFGETGHLEVVNGGNFHAEPVAMAADNMALAVAEIGAISERRIAMLIDPASAGCRPSWHRPRVSTRGS